LTFCLFGYKRNKGTSKNWPWRDLGPHPLQLLQWVSLVSLRGTRIFRGAHKKAPNLTHQAPATTGAFYFINQAQSTRKGIQYLTTLNLSAAILSSFRRQNEPWVL
jgi:hypothetical protein